MSAKREFNAAAKECQRAARDLCGVAEVLRRILEHGHGPNSPEALTAAAICGRVRAMADAADYLARECYSMQYADRGRPAA